MTDVQIGDIIIITTDDYNLTVKGSIGQVVRKFSNFHIGVDFRYVWHNGVKEKGKEFVIRATDMSILRPQELCRELFYD